MWAAFGDLANALADSFVLAVTAWVVVVGGVGAALGSQAGRPGTGFLVSVITPVPVLGWLLVIALNYSGGGRRRRRKADADNAFSALLED